MAITVTMIEEKEFTRKLHGYDDHEVDEFLDEICDEMVNMQREITSLQQRNQQLTKQLENPVRASFTPATVPPPASPTVPIPVARPAVTPAPAPAPAASVNTEEVKKLEEEARAKRDAAVFVLEKAQKVYDETVRDAKNEAERILKDARVNSENGMERLESEKKAALEELDTIKARIQDYKKRFVQMLEDQQHLMSTDQVLFGKDENRG